MNNLIKATNAVETLLKYVGEHKESCKWQDIVDYAEDISSYLHRHADKLMYHKVLTLDELQLKVLISLLIGLGNGKHKGDIQYLYTSLKDCEIPENIMGMISTSYHRHYDEIK